MAVQAYKSDQLADGYRGRPTEDHGKLRLAYFKSTVTVQGDALSTFDLCKLPTGAVRVLPGLSRISCSALGAARVLDVGHRAYTKKGDGTQEAEALNAFANDIDVSGAVAGAAIGTAIKYDLYSTGGVTVAAQVAGGTVPVNAVLEGYIAYVYE